ncbi:MAG: hypothetical protein Kow0081_0310 [Candidatus Dojkabacteria bacterium]
MSNLDDNLYEKLESDLANSAPRAGFKEELFSKLEVYEKLQEKSHTSSNFISYFYIFMRRNVLLPVLVLVLALVLGGGGIALLVSQNDSDSNTQGTQASNTVLKGAFEKNPNLYLGQSANSETSIDPRLIAKNDTTFANLYTVTTQTVNFGPAFETCRNANDLSNLSKLTATRKISTYVDKETFATREEHLTADDELIYLSITNNEDMYTFRGGEYAVYQNLDWFNEEFFDANSRFVAAVDDTNALLEEFDNFITEVFELEEAPVVETYDDSVSITTKYPATCKTFFSADSTIVRVIELDPETYEIVKEEWYKDSQDEDNLIVTFETSVQSANRDFSDVEDEFELERDIDIKEGDFGNTFTIDEDAILTVVEDNNLTVVVPASSDFEAVDISIPQDDSLPIFDLYAAREFYPEGDLGDELYEEFGGKFGSAEADLGMFLVSVSFANFASIADLDLETATEEDFEALTKFDLITVLVTEKPLEIESNGTAELVLDGDVVEINAVDAEKELANYVREFDDEFSIFELETESFTYYIIVSNESIIEDYEFETLAEVSDFESIIESANSLF